MFFNKFQLNLGWDKIGKCLRKISIGCHWVLPKTNFGNALHIFWYHANEFGLGDNSKTSQKDFNRFQPNFGWETIWNCLRKTSKGCHWILPETHFGNALQPFWFLVPCKWVWARRQLENVLENFIRFQLKLGWDQIFEYLRINSIVCHWISPKTHYGNALQHFGTMQTDMG